MNILNRHFTRGGLIVLFLLLLGGTLAWADSSSREDLSVQKPSKAGLGINSLNHDAVPAASPSEGLSTPELIEAALFNGEIDQETADLYLAYALGDHEKLPSQFVSNVPWHGTLPLLSLREGLETMKISAARSTHPTALTFTSNTDQSLADCLSPTTAPH